MYYRCLLWGGPIILDFGWGVAGVGGGQGGLTGVAIRDHGVAKFFEGVAKILEGVATGWQWGGHGVARGGGWQGILLSLHC